jgi:hypothetical protein
MLRCLGLEVEQRPGHLEYLLTHQAAKALQVEHQRIQALHRRSMKLAAAARALNVALSTAALLSRTGQLDIDPETDSSGARFVTRTSVQQCWLDRQLSTRPRADTGSGVPIVEVARFTGQTTGELTELVQTGALEEVPGRRGRQVSVRSLLAWMPDADSHRSL